MKKNTTQTRQTSDYDVFETRIADKYDELSKKYDFTSLSIEDIVNIKRVIKNYLNTCDLITKIGRKLAYKKEEINKQITSNENKLFDEIKDLIQASSIMKDVCKQVEEILEEEV